MTLFMDMGLGLKKTPPKHENIPKLEFSLGLGHNNDIIHGYGVGVENPPPKHENIPRLEFSLGWGTKMTLFMDMGLGLKTPPQNMIIFQSWNSH